MARLKAGQLRHRVTIEAPAVSNVGEATDFTWNTHAANVPAAILPLSGRELMAAGTELGAQRVRFVLRYGNAGDVTTAMRIAHEGKTYNILEVIPDPTLRDSVTLIAEAGVRG